ncbi:MAG: transcriptional regulator [Lachnospiraceae bacterium]|nr:transcriptional regulator [Lachnospiraceae bacterium]
MTAKELGQITGLSERIINNYEDGIEIPKGSEIIAALADSLECKAEELTAAIKEDDNSKEAVSYAADLPFGVRLRNLRTDKGLTLNQAAEAAGISVGQYKAHENGNARPRNAALYDRFAKVLGCEAAYLKEGDERFENGILKETIKYKFPKSSDYIKVA